MLPRLSDHLMGEHDYGTFNKVCSPSNDIIYKNKEFYETFLEDGEHTITAVESEMLIEELEQGVTLDGVLKKLEDKRNESIYIKLNDGSNNEFKTIIIGKKMIERNTKNRRVHHVENDCTYPCKSTFLMHNVSSAARINQIFGPLKTSLKPKTLNVANVIVLYTYGVEIPFP